MGMFEVRRVVDQIFWQCILFRDCKTALGICRRPYEDIWSSVSRATNVYIWCDTR
jgi:hypothetical protein